jgi:CRP/FNR family transcriptional regulator, cyclic AMP receptor protein
VDRKVELISKVPLFSRCSKHELQQLAAAADEIDLPEGKVLTREGDRGREFFVLLGGTAVVQQGGQTIRTLGPGDFLGEIALISHEPRTATVITTSPVQALVITDQSFAALLDHLPSVERTVLQTLADRLAPQSL